MKKIILSFIFIGILSGVVAGQLDSKASRTKVARKKKAASSVNQKPQKAESYIFPVDGKKKDPDGKPFQVFSGTYIGNSSKPAPKEKNEIKKFDFSQEEIERIKTEKAEKDKAIIAWTQNGDTCFHDPFLACKDAEKKVNLIDVSQLAGLDPCENCFLKTNHAPEFILNESGGLDIASATTLLSEKEFLTWMKSHLPIKEANYITSNKIMVYAKNEMTKNGLKQLAGEVAKAHRRHRWKVVEVMAKNSEESLEFENSF